MQEAVNKSVVFLRFHGTINIAAGSLMAVLATIGNVYAVGHLGELTQGVAGYLGLLQAYLLFAVVGLSMWGATLWTRKLRLWHLCGLFARLPAFVLIILFWDWMVGNGITTNSIYFHAVFIALEGAFFLFARSPVTADQQKVSSAR